MQSRKQSNCSGFDTHKQNVITSFVCVLSRHTFKSYEKDWFSGCSFSFNPLMLIRHFVERDGFCFLPSMPSQAMRRISKLCPDLEHSLVEPGSGGYKADIIPTDRKSVV